MKLFGSISELVSAVFRKNSQAITLRPNQATTYTTSRDIQTPAQDADSILVSRNSTDTLTNKSIDGGSNTLTNIPASGVTGVVAPVNGGTGIANNNAATLTRSGNHAVTLTTTATTSVTLPTAGTLATLAGTETLTNKTLTGNTAVNLVSGSGTAVLNTTGTVTLPNATDTLVGKATTDTLTNKTLNGNTATNLISGSGTFTFNTTGTITAPNATDTLVGKATTDTLTNKTLTSPSITTPTITSPVVTGGATVRGDLLLQNTAGSQPTLQLSETPANGTNKITLQAPANLAADYTLTLPVDDGTSNQVLSTDGSGVLSWAASAAVPATAGNVYSDGSALQSIAFSGNANKVFGVNNAATSEEAKSLLAGTAGTDFAVAHAAGSITFNLPDASLTARGAVTTADQSFNGIKLFDDGLKLNATGTTDQATLGDYREGTVSTSFTFNGTGSPGTTNSVTINMTRVGKMVIIRIPSASGTSGTNSTRCSSNTALPTWARPATEAYAVGNSTRDNTTTRTDQGLWQIEAGGTLRFYMFQNQTGTFTNAASCGWNNPQLLCYDVN